MSVTREQVIAVLETIKDPTSGSSLAGSPALKALTVEEGSVRVVLEIAPDLRHDDRHVEAGNRGGRHPAPDSGDRHHGGPDHRRPDPL